MKVSFVDEEAVKMAKYEAEKAKCRPQSEINRLVMEHIDNITPGNALMIECESFADARRKRNTLYNFVYYHKFDFSVVQAGSNVYVIKNEEEKNE